MPKLSFTHLISLSAIAELGSAVAVAERLHITPSAVTHRVREAERRLDTQLVHRVGHRLVLTEAGQRLVEVADKVTSEMLRIETDICRAASADAEVVRIGMCSCISFRWVVDFMNHVVGEGLPAGVEVVNVASADATKRLLDGEIDVLVSKNDIRHPDIGTQLLFLDEVRIVVSPSDPWCDRVAVDLSELCERTVLTPKDIDAVRSTPKVYFSSGDAGHSCAAAWNAPEPLVELVAESGGIGVASAWAVQPYVGMGRVRAARLTGCDSDLAWHLSTMRDPRGMAVSRCAESLLNWWKRQEWPALVEAEVEPVIVK